jgi:hypothetical protein
MSLLSTIAYDGTHETREIPFKGIGAVVAALVLGAAIGFVIADNPPAVDAPVAAATGMALDDFIRLNTTSYEGLSPTAAAPQADAQSFIEMNVTSFEGLAPVTATVDPFFEMNIASYEGLAPVTAAVATPQTVTDSFLHMNIASYEGLAPVTAAVAAPQSVVDPNFIYWNTVAFESLTPTAIATVSQSPQAVDASFWDLNVTSLEYPVQPYVEQSSGPR